jgi:hypothetical protein
MQLAGVYGILLAPIEHRVVSEELLLRTPGQVEHYADAIGTMALPFIVPALRAEIHERDQRA